MLKREINQPPYKLTDLFAATVANINSKLRIPGNEIISTDLQFRFGYYTELIQEVEQLETPGFDSSKYPFLWLVQPFTLVVGDGLNNDYYATVKNGPRLFIVMESDKDLKAAERELTVFDPMLNPIYNQLIPSMKSITGFKIPLVGTLKHEVTSRYYWGTDQQQVLPDVADCIEVNFDNLIINNNLNC